MTVVILSIHRGMMMAIAVEVSQRMKRIKGRVLIGKTFISYSDQLTFTGVEGQQLYFKHFKYG
jgi:hypothetical protein